MLPAKSFMLALSTIVLSSCDFLLGGEEDGLVLARERAVIQFDSDTMVVDVPARAVRNQAFEIVVWTYGGGCMRPADTQVQHNGMMVTVEPYDSFVVRQGQIACSYDIRHYKHAALLTFEQSGLATILIRGRKQPGLEIVSTSRSVTVE